MTTCHEGVCYTGTKDKRCKGKKNEFDLKDGGWCWEGRRDIMCPAPPANMCTDTS